MLRDFNLLILTGRGNESKCSSELWFILREVGISEQVIDRTDFSGLLVAKVNVDPFKAIKMLREYVVKRPWDIRYLLKVTPIEIVVDTSLGNIFEAAKKLASKISEEETYRVTVNKRGVDLETSSLVEAAAKAVNRKVDLKKPDKILLVEVLGSVTGLSVVREEDILSISKIKERYLKGEE
ncbi:MAG: RNA-binding protein [Candidatus Methanomethylicota archaeon]|uniref:RNA-binding protein n=1 Tax=Thermoproteota archaeon TaxID=2056631 RepID=A0A497ERU7_9CREN|nr:MAG: RNA-binding protein [Candidatus Verstraetearchaeota archaeon]